MTTTESLIRAILKVFEGHHHKDSFAQAIHKLQPSFPEYFPDDNQNPLPVFLAPFEHAFRIYLEQQLLEVLSTSTDALRQSIVRLFDLSIWCVSQSFANESLPFIILEDIYALLTIQQCEEVFDIFEDRMDTLTPLINTGPGKRFIRTNISLLSRLTNSINIQLKGRVLLFVAAGVPPSDKSGVNRGGDTHKDEVEFEENLPEDMQISTDRDRPVDYKFYRTFWSLQKYFQNPSALVSSTEMFANFSIAAVEVIAALENWPIREASRPVVLDAPAADQMDVDEQEDVAPVLGNCSPFFKYIASTKLLGLQMGDSRFQRHVLVQFAVLIHGLEVLHTEKLNEQQVDRLDKLKLRVRDNLAKHDGEFAAIVQKTLSMEKYWIKWKKDGCPDLSKPPMQPLERASLPDVDMPTLPPTGQLDLGSESLNAIWNSSKDNYELLDKQGTTEPSVRTVVEDELLSEFEDEEEDMKHKNSPMFVWKATRVMTKQKLDYFALMKYSAPAGFDDLQKYLRNPPKTEA